MCHAVRCSICHKTTWSGCGRHANQVLANVPKAQRCKGHSAAELKASRASTATQGGFLARLIGR